jgi:hypothetical protein
MSTLSQPIWPAFTLSLLACASSQEAAVGVSTAPQSVPAQAPEVVDAAVAAPIVLEVDAGTRLPEALGRLHPITGMSAGAKKLDAKVLIARIERRPETLDRCSALASVEPNAPDGSWNVRLTLKGGAVALVVESAVEPAFQQCLEAAAKEWQFHGMPDGEMMLLLGLAL